MDDFVEAAVAVWVAGATVFAELHFGVVREAFSVGVASQDSETGHVGAVGEEVSVDGVAEYCGVDGDVAPDGAQDGGVGGPDEGAVWDVVIGGHVDVVSALKVGELVAQAALEVFFDVKELQYLWAGDVDGLGVVLAEKGRAA